MTSSGGINRYIVAEVVVELQQKLPKEINTRTLINFNIAVAACD